MTNKHAIPWMYTESMVASEAGDWVPLSIDSDLEGRASKLVPALLSETPFLPLEELSWEDFERLQWRLLRDAEGLRGARRYGRRGQAQHGLDIVALDSDGSGVALQSKKYKKFTATNLNDAVKKFRTAERPFSVSRFIIGVACEADDTKVVETLLQCEKELEPVRLELWDREEISARLRGHPSIVIDFFGPATAEHFCWPFTIQTVTVPGPEAVAVSEAVARTPERVTGAEAKFRKADEVQAKAPGHALELVEEGQRLLRDAGFRAHAVRHEESRARLLIKLGRAVDAARARMDEVWAALDAGKGNAAQVAGHHLRQVAAEVPDDERVSALVEIANRAIGLGANPLGRLPDPDSLICGDAEDMWRLLVLAGETALANDRLDWLKQASKAFACLAATEDADETWRIRSRILLADATGDWSALLSDARRRRLGHALGALVIARYARHQALHQQFEEADELWDQAIGDACLARRWMDGRTWVFSRRVFRLRWNPRTADELLPVEVALREMGPSNPTLPRDDGACTTALEELRAENLRSAAIAAQRALRQAVASADWAGEERARRVLGSVLGASEEPELAVRHLARAADVSGMQDISSRFTNRYIDISDSLDSPNYWTVGTAYRLLAIEADLIPDEVIDNIAGKLIAELSGAESGTVPDFYSYEFSRYRNAVRTLAGIADRLTQEQAEAVLTHFEKQLDPGVDRYRLHDEDEATAVARIALNQLALRRRAIVHLVPLMARSQRSRKSITMDALAISEDIVRPCLEKQVELGCQWAREVLVDLFDDVFMEDSEAALVRLTAPLEHTPGAYEIGTNAVGDSLLVRGLSAEQRDRAIGELLGRTEDTHVALADRGDYLLAASSLVEGLDERARRSHCEAALRVAGAPAPSEFDRMHLDVAHPLGSVHMSFDTGDTPAKALYLAACLAVDGEQHARIKHLAYQMIGPDDRSGYWATRALRQLQDTDALNDDLGFLSGQGCAARSLAAAIWARHPSPPHLGARLATDLDPRVRRALAEGLSKVDPASEQMDVRQLLVRDPAYSVRRCLTAPGA